MHGLILAEYQAKGQNTSPLGAPISEETPIAGGRVSYFNSTCGGTNTCAGVVLLVIWGLCAILAALFHTDPIPPKGPLSLSGTIHITAANIGFFSLAGAILICSGHLRTLFGRSVWTRLITWLALASVVSLILFLIAFVVAVTFGVFVHGLFERLVIAVDLAWLSTVALLLLSLPTDQRERP